MPKSRSHLYALLCSHASFTNRSQLLSCFLLNLLFFLLLTQTHLASALLINSELSSFVVECFLDIHTGTFNLSSFNSTSSHHLVYTLFLFFNLKFWFNKKWAWQLFYTVLEQSNVAKCKSLNLRKISCRCFDEISVTSSAIKLFIAGTPHVPCFITLCLLKPAYLLKVCRRFSCFRWTWSALWKNIWEPFTCCIYTSS